MSFRFLFLFILLVSCATETPHVVDRKETPPFLKRYKKKSKELIYIATLEKDVIDDPTKNLIRKTVKKFDPEIIVTKFPVEGEYRLENDLSRCENGFGCTTSAWTCLMAKPRGIPCVSGEPFHSEILKRARRKKLINDDVLFFYTFRALVQTLKGKKSPLDGLSVILEEQKKVLNMANRMDEEVFIRMYQDKMNSKTILVGKPEIRPDSGGHYLQRIAKILQDSEEELILEKIQKEQRGHERVLVVYGIDHYERHLDPLEDFFSSHLP